MPLPLAFIGLQQIVRIRSFLSFQYLRHLIYLGLRLRQLQTAFLLLADADNILAQRNAPPTPKPAAFTAPTPTPATTFALR
jgi:hypothetical protein